MRQHGRCSGMSRSWMRDMPIATDAVTHDITRFFVTGVSVKWLAFIGPLPGAVGTGDRSEVATGRRSGCGLRWRPGDGAHSRAVRFSRRVLVIDVQGHAAAADEDFAGRGVAGLAQIPGGDLGRRASANKEDKWDDSRRQEAFHHGSTNQGLSLATTGTFRSTDTNTMHRRLFRLVPRLFHQSEACMAPTLSGRYGGAR